MSTRIGLGIVCLILVALPCHRAVAYTLEFHPGIYTSYEYTDNYYGDPRNEESEGIYEVGPSLTVLLLSPTFRWDLTGYLAQSYHQDLEDEDSTEARLASTATVGGQITSMSISYAYSQTRRRESLGETAGIRRTHSGSVSIEREMSQRTALRLATDATKEINDRPTEDTDSWGGNAGLTWRATRRNTIDLTFRHDLHTYEIREDTQTTASTAHWGYALSPRLTLGIVGDYVHVNRGDDPNEDIYDTSATMEYTPYQNIALSLRGGYSWLVLENGERGRTYTMAGDLTGTTDRDTFTLSVSKGYRAEFTADRYGTYDVRAARLSWERRLLRTVSSSVSVAYEDSRPSFEGVEEDETDVVAGGSLAWSPVEYVDTRLSYEHLRHTYEISDTVMENRYRVIVEVRY
ncbi:MAG: hypothetical protein ACP5G0_06905 [Desulfomonilia bacterium]